MSRLSDYINTRDDYISMIKKELLGPGSEISLPDEEHELISGQPHQRYSMGILFPKRNTLQADNNDSDRAVALESSLDEIESREQDFQEKGFTTIKSSNNEPEEDIDLDENGLDEEVSLAAQNMPSSMGMSFLVSKNIDILNCEVSFGTYRRASWSDCILPYEIQTGEDELVKEFCDFLSYSVADKYLKLERKINNDDILKFKKWSWPDEKGEFYYAVLKLFNQFQKGFVRVPHSLSVAVDFSEGEYVDSNRNLDNTKLKITALKRIARDGIWSITLMLVNDCDEKESATNCIFQPEIIVSTDNNDFVFCEYSSLVDMDLLSDEEKSLELQYRKKRSFGSGLGTSVDWSIDGLGTGCIYSEYFPSFEVPQMDFSVSEEMGINTQAMSMWYLSDLNEAPRKEKVNGLKTIVNAYGNWIKGLEKDVESLDEKFVEIANTNIEGCKKALKRMNNGLNILEDNDVAWSAFELANRAMVMQRSQVKMQDGKDRYPYDEELINKLEKIDYNDFESLPDDRYEWRLFQIAFLLMSLSSITDEEGEDRQLVDLIWFPTGGGKTEAYLGLTAFTIFYRRLSHLDTSNGTAVIMRYTLRLLAAQQFARAATLICACEYIRCDSLKRRHKYKKYPLGNQEITIGLWIGSEHIPNTNDDAKNKLKKLTEASANDLNYRKNKYNKFQLLKCPWCGTKMVKDLTDKGVQGTFGYRMNNGRHFQLFCPQEACFFNQKGHLPVQIIDEELYRNPPTLLFGTVDKFAMMPWKEDIKAFFGVGSNNRPPELIIQDELHLISGPLGTMVGLYESVIDIVCNDRGVTPKIVASTATIRKAKEQCSALYDRDVAQFPHPGLNAEDSFFAREAEIDHAKDIYGRQYVGIMPSGKTKAMTEARAMAALAQIMYMMDLPEDIKDNYWTLTAYFNSLKDLGKASTLVDDDVKDFIKRTAYRLAVSGKARRIYSSDELTSRVNTTELNETLDKLEKRHYSKENIDNKKYPSDILLATNMISVGIDIARLNVMLVVGQPKLTSEYIQATSRVGRSFPGVAFVQYDGTKSRDRSHYEQFKSYHESFYKFVEPTGATPFSKPARDRALHAVAIAMMRMLEPQLSNDLSAGTFSVEIYKDRINEIKHYLSTRSEEIQQRINTDMESEADDIEREVEDLFDHWEKLASLYDEGLFSYGEKYLMKKPDIEKGRLLKPFNSGATDSAFETMTSMRNVDASLHGHILLWGDE